MSRELRAELSSLPSRKSTLFLGVTIIHVSNSKQPASGTNLPSSWKKSSYIGNVLNIKNYS